MGKSLLIMISFCIFPVWADIDALINLSIEDLLNVEIDSASKKSEKLFNAPLSISSVSALELKSAGATSWGEALRLIPGVIVREQTPGNYDIHIRGFDNSPPDSLLPFLANTLTLVMIDYRIVYNYFAGGTFWETLPLSISNVERIEVIRGPSSPLYGPNAVTGVIHIISKSVDKPGFTLSSNVEAGQNNTTLGAISMQYQAENWSWQGSASQRKRERNNTDYYSFVSGETVSDALELIEFDTQQASPLNAEHFVNQKLAQDIEAITTQFSYHLSDDWRLGLTLGGEDSIVQKAYFENGLTPLNTAYSDSQFIDFRSEDKNLTTQLSYLSGEQGAFGVSSWQWDFSTLDFNMEYSHKINEKINIIPGLSYRKATYDAPFINGKHDIITKAISLRADLRPSQQWRIITALRADKYKIPDTTEIASQLSISYTAHKALHWRFNYGRSSRTPFMLDTFQDSRFTTSNGLLFELFGNKNLKPLVTDALEVGMRYNINDQQQFEAEIFKVKNKNYSDVQLQFVGQDGDFFRTTGQYENLPFNPKLKGITLSYHHYFSVDTYLKAFVTFTDANATNHIQQPEGPPGADLENVTLVNIENGATPKYYGGFIVNHRLNNWLINLNGYYFDNHKMTHVIDDDAIKSKFTLNFKIQYSISTDLDVYLNIKNLNNSSDNEFLYTDHTNRKIQFGISGTFNSQ